MCLTACFARGANSPAPVESDRIRPGFSSLLSFSFHFSIAFGLCVIYVSLWAVIPLIIGAFGHAASKQESPMRAMAEQDEAEDEIEVEVEVATAAVSGAWR
jgi:hypothetical protein